MPVRNTQVALIDKHADWIDEIAQDDWPDGEPLILTELGSGGLSALQLKTARGVRPVNPDAYGGVVAVP